MIRREDPTAKAREALERIRAEQRRLEAEAADYEAYLRVHEKLSGGAVQEAASAKVTLEEPGYASTPEIIGAVRDYLRQRGGPAHIRDIFQHLEFQGIRIAGRSPAGNLSAKLASANDLAYQRDVGWWFVDPERAKAELYEKFNVLFANGQRSAPSDASPSRLESGSASDVE